MDRRFTALRVIGTVFKILAWITLVLGLITAVGMLILGFTLDGQEGLLGLDFGGSFAGVAMFVVFVIIAVFSFVSLYAIGEAVYLFLSIEESTRRIAYIAQHQFASFQAPYPSSPPQDEIED